MAPPFVRLDNGAILFIGDIPKVFDGYEQDSRHLNTWYPIWDPCKYRTERPYRCPQGNIRLVTTCDLLEQIVSYAKCSTCDLIEPPLDES